MFGCYHCLVMAESEYLAGLAIRGSDTGDSPRHPVVIRITHWINTLSFFGLLVSGIAILISHPRLYWGETGSVGTPSLIDLPIPFVLANQNGWGRYLHFLSAWICVLNGLFYALSGVFGRHFRNNLLPAKADLAWGSFSRAVSSHLRLKRPSEEESLSYNVLQRLAYSGVVFVLLPLAIGTGLAMSPAITSVFPGLVTVLGGQQSARTVHFFAAGIIVVFLLVHVGMVCLAGFRNRVGAMITGHGVARREHA
jgi:thiosulfate reductase cytochrome b subunit